MLDELGPFDSVLDVGGNVGEFAEWACKAWPAAQVTSFEPVPMIAEANRRRALRRWRVEGCAVSSQTGAATIRFCVNQHSASTMQEPGTTRRERFRIFDRFETFDVVTRRLDEFVEQAPGRCLVKIDVEGHELEVIRGGADLLRRVAAAGGAVVCEVNQDPGIFVGAPPPAVVDDELRRCGFYFAGVLAVQLDPRGQVVQFDGVWSR